MWPNLVSNPGPLTYESGALPTAYVARLHGVDDSILKQKFFEVYDTDSPV